MNGAGGLKTAQEENPDLALLDPMMPGMNGFELCKIMKENEALRHIPLIVFTAKVHREARNGSLALGVDDCIVKPYDSKELLAKIEGLLYRGG